MKSVNFDLDQSSKIKLYFQLYTKLSEQILSGEIPAGTKLPSVRTLSTQLNISRNTVTKALEDLQNDGFIVSKNKSGFYAIIPEKKSVPNNGISSSIPDADIVTEKTVTSSAKPKNSILTVDDILAKAASTLEKTANIESVTENNVSFDETVPEEEAESVPTIDSMLNISENISNLSPKEDTEPEISDENSASLSIAIPQDPVIASYLEAYQSQEFQELDTASIELNFELSLKSSYLYKNISVDYINLIYETNISHLMNNLAKLSVLRTIITPAGENQQPKQGGLLKIATQAQINSKIQPVMFTCGLNKDYEEDNLISSIFKKNNYYVEDVQVSSLTPEYLALQNVSLLLVTDEEMITEEVLSWCHENSQHHIICLTDSTIMNPQKQCIYISTLSKLTDSKVKTSWALLDNEIYSDYRNTYPQNQNGISLMDKCFCSKFMTNLSAQNQ